MSRCSCWWATREPAPDCPAAAACCSTSAIRAISTTCAIAIPSSRSSPAAPAWPWQDDMIAVMLHKPNVWNELHGWSPKYLTEALQREISRPPEAPGACSAPTIRCSATSGWSADWRSAGLRRRHRWSACSSRNAEALFPALAQALAWISRCRARSAIVGGASQGIGLRDRAPARQPRARAVAMVARRSEPLEDAVAARRATRPAARRSRSPPTSARRRTATRIVDERRRGVSAASTSWSTTTARRRWASSRRSTMRRGTRRSQQNLMSVVRLSPSCDPASAARRRRAAIVNITALSALQPMPRFGLSVATWAGVLGYAKTLSLEVAARRRSPSTRSARAASPPAAWPRCSAPAAGQPTVDDRAARRDARSRSRCGRLGTPDEIAGLVAFLASP